MFEIWVSKMLLPNYKTSRSLGHVEQIKFISIALWVYTGQCLPCVSGSTIGLNALNPILRLGGRNGTVSIPHRDASCFTSLYTTPVLTVVESSCLRCNQKIHITAPQTIAHLDWSSVSNSILSPWRPFFKEISCFLCYANQTIFLGIILNKRLSDTCNTLHILF